MSYELRDHTADVAVAASAETLGGVFAAVADGMAAAMADDVPDGGERREITVTAEGREALLFDYLDELIYERDVRGVLPVDNDATVTGPGEREPVESATGETGTDESVPDHDWQVTASYRGVPLCDVDARDLKAVTYSEMEISECADGWRAYVVFDV